MCGPIPIVMGIVSAGLGIGQAVAGAKAATQQADLANAQSAQAYQFNMMQSQSARTYEALRANQQEELQRITRLMADNAYANDVAALNARLMQEQSAASQEQQKGAIAGAKARGEILATGRLGNTVDNLMADYYRQQAQFDFATSQNLAFTGQQIQSQKQGAAAERGSRIASQQAYIKQPVLDPLAPIEQAKPSMTPFLLQGAGAVMSGINTGMSTAASMDKAGYKTNYWGFKKK